jgi:adenosine deaminase
MLSRDLIRRMPKAELHVHLDGSLRAETMLELAAAAGLALPADEPEALRRFMLVDDAADLEAYLARFAYTIALLQTPESIARVAYELVQDAAADGVRYIEVRYCPWLSTKGGLSLNEVLAAEVDGLARAEREFGTVARIINCSLRHYDPTISATIAEHSVAWSDRGVVAFDLAGGEAGRPPEVHQRAFDIAAEGLLGITVHAGEAAGPRSIATALHQCHANRIGHGTRLRESPALEAYVRDRRIPLEMNVTSNVQTHAVAALADHPVARYLRAGIVATLCTDNWLMSGVSLTDEYVTVQAQFGLSRDEVERLMLNGFASAFLPLPERERLLADARVTLAALRT